MISYIIWITNIKYGFMNDGTKGLVTFIENTRMRLNTNFDANSGSYMPYR